MKHIKSIAATSLLGAAVLLSAGASSASTRANPSYITGSDTLINVMNDLFEGTGNTLGDGLGIEFYQGTGSSAGERQMEGSPTGDEDLCSDPTDANGGTETNPGCQEISPMSRQMDNSICEDDAVAPALQTQSEGLAVCMDGIVLLARNYAKGQFGQDVASCNAYPEANTTNDGVPPTFTDYNVGELNATRDIDCNGDGDTTDSADVTLNDWRDVLRLMYTGCLPGDGTCANVAGLDRYERCDPDFTPAADDRGSKRACLIKNWANLFENNTACADSADYCRKGVLRALRRDDASGTTQLFLEVLGVAGNLTPRTGVLRSPGAGCKAPGSNNNNPTDENTSTFAFCDGGESETIFAADNVYPVGGSAEGDTTFSCDGVHGDPLKTLCAVEEDVCDIDGKLGVVMAIRTPPVSNAYPPRQCSLRKFAVPAVGSAGQWLASSENVCPDGTKPSGGLCQLPYFDLGGGNKDFNCINRRDSLPATLPADPPKDGRVYNFVVRDAAGNIAHNTAAGGYPSMATWRVNMAGIRTPAIGEGTGDYTASTSDCPGNPTTLETSGQFRCTQTSATDVIACATAQNYSRLPNAALGGTCPAAQPVDGSACGVAPNPLLQLCNYDGARCRCERATPSSSPTWECNDAPTCLVGFAGREAAALDTYDNCQEPFEVNDVVASNPNILARKPGLPAPASAYPLNRFLFVNAINGFENIEADCLASGRGADYCNDELEIAELFHDPLAYLTGTGEVWNACANNGFIPLELDAVNPAAPTAAELEVGGPACLGTSVSTASPALPGGCGRPEAQGCTVDPVDGVDRECTRDACVPN